MQIVTPLYAARCNYEGGILTLLEVVAADDDAISARPVVARGADDSVPAETTPIRLNSLTAMRFFAAFGVVLYHAWPGFTGVGELGYLRFGYLGVGFFFILSGVVLAWSWRPTTSIITQWRRRLARIGPLYWLLTLVVAVTYFSMPEVAPQAVKPTPGGLFVVMGFLQAWPPFHHLLDFNFPSWSLSTELFFYALFPFVVVVLAKRKKATLLITGGGVVATYLIVVPLLYLARFPTLYTGNMLAFPPLQLLKFTAGVCIGLALRKGWRPRLQPGTAVAILVGSIALIPTLATSWTLGAGFRSSEIFPDLVVTVPVIMLIVAAASADLRGQRGVGSSRVLVRLGEWSFALYLVHAPVLIFSYVIRIRTGFTETPGLAWLGVYLLVAVGFSGVLHTWFELPLERILRGRRRQPATGDRHPQGSDPVPAQPPHRGELAVPEETELPQRPHLVLPEPERGQEVWCTKTTTSPPAIMLTPSHPSGVTRSCNTTTLDPITNSSPAH